MGFTLSQLGRGVCGQEDRLLSGKPVTDVSHLVDTRDYRHSQWARENFSDLVQCVMPKVNRELLRILKDFHAFQARHALRVLQHIPTRIGKHGRVLLEEICHPTLINMLLISLSFSL